MRYVRARRLTEAARALARGAPDILSLALEANYEIHEAFTRAFRDQFGMTPEAVRAATCLDRLKLQEAILMDSTMSETLGSPRYETAKAFLVAGVAERCLLRQWRHYPRTLWQRYHREVADITARADNAAVPVAYGVCCNGDDAGNIDYIAGIEVFEFFDLPRRVRAASQFPSSAMPVFTHTEHVALDPPHHQCDMESMAAGLRPEGR